MIDKPPIFYEAKLKIERANKHIDDLNQLINRFVATDFYRFHIDVDANTGDNILKLEFIEPIPTETPLIVGDAVHNLHTALDLLACEIVSRAGKTVDMTIKFPFFQKRQELIGQLNTGKIKAAGQKIIHLIVDTIKPYRGGNDMLYGLHDLDILDKHRLLISMGAITGISGINAEDENHNVLKNVSASIGEGGRLHIFTTRAKLHVKSHGKPIFAVFFGKAQPFEGKPLVPTLHQLSKLVSNSVDILERHYVET